MLKRQHSNSSSYSLVASSDEELPEDELKDLSSMSETSNIDEEASFEYERHLSDDEVAARALFKLDLEDNSPQLPRGRSRTVRPATSARSGFDKLIGHAQARWLGPEPVVVPDGVELGGAPAGSVNEKDENNASHIILNGGNGEEAYPPIYLHKALEKHLRGHQVDGLRFLWNKIINGEECDPPRPQGALLAHTMGLGKTVTVIAFLFTLALTRALPKMQRQIALPEHLTKERLRVLILVPGGLVFNWKSELDRWAIIIEKEINNLCPGLDGGRGSASVQAAVSLLADSISFASRQQMALTDRISILKDWRKRGGVLIMGYELFKRLVDPDRILTDELKNRLSFYLLDPGPELAIADEAHLLKNPMSLVTKVVKSISCTSRIALTASPLPNDLLNFYSLFDWISPGALGNSPQSFNQRFRYPIKKNFDATCKLDDQDEEIKSKLFHMIRRTEGKIHRRGGETLTRYLEAAKTEFIIRVPLTVEQLHEYQQLIQMQDASAMWRTHCLRSICNHPKIYTAMRSKSPENRQTQKRRKINKRIQTSDHAPKEVPSGSVSGPSQSENGKDHMISLSMIQTPNGKELKPGLEDEHLSDLEESVHERMDDGESEEDAMERQSKQSSQSGPPNNIDQTHSSCVLSAPQSGFETNSNTSRAIPPLHKKMISITKLRGSNKILLLMYLLREFRKIDDKTLVFSHSIHTLDYLEALVRQENFAVCRLDGEVMFHQRNQDISMFNGGAYDIYMVSTKAGGVGLNLQRANRVFIFDNDHSPVWEQQAIGRSYRIGQKKRVYVYKFLVAGTFETKVAREKYKKVRLSDILIDQEWIPRESYIKEDEDHVDPFEEPELVEVPDELPDMSWRGRDEVLDRVVDCMRPRIITEIDVDLSETTNFNPVAESSTQNNILI